jgi:hypothetical protein
METDVTLNNIRSYFAGLNSTLKSTQRVQELYNSKVAFKFNLFNFWYPQENKISQILAFFLDPAETHGQGDAFLKIFVKRLGLDEFKCDTTHVSVKCEQGIDNQRRIDILLSFGNNTFGIAIENKLWALDQDFQLYDYAEFLKKKFNNNYLLLYLTPDGRDPGEKSIIQEYYQEHKKAGRIRTIGYIATVIDMVREWAMTCNAERVRNFLYDFEQYFKQQFLGDTFMNQSDVIAEFVQSNVENVQAAFETYKAFEIIKKQIADKFTKRLAFELGQVFSHDDWKVEIIDAFNVIVNHVSWPCNTVAGVMNYDKDGVHFGIKTESGRCRELFGFVKSHNSGDENNNAYWLKMNHPYNIWDNTIDGMKKIYEMDKDSLAYMIDKVKRLTELIDLYFKENPDFC